MLSYLLFPFLEIYIIVSSRVKYLLGISEDYHTPGQNGPVIFLSGIVGGWSKFGLTKYLKNHDVNAYLPNFGVKSKPLDYYATEIHKLVRRKNLHNVTIVGRSLGGLITLKYAQKYGWDNIKNIFLVATPIYGVRKFPLLKYTRFKYLLPNSPELVSLQSLKFPPKKVICIHGKWDQFMPSQNTIFPGSKTIKVNAVGHNITGLPKNLHPIYDKYL